MRKNLLLALLALVTIVTLALTGLAAMAESDSIPIDEAHFPDENFREYVADSFDLNGDGSLSLSEREAVDEIDCYNMGISDLTGIRYFGNLEWLWCHDNNLVALDVSENTALRYLGCSFNQLTTLDVSRNKELFGLDCNDNNLAYLNVSGCESLDFIDCRYNALTQLDLNGCSGLYDLECYGNHIQQLDISGCECLIEAYEKDAEKGFIEYKGNANVLGIDESVDLKY